jgi:hypothetical protein
VSAQVGLTPLSRVAKGHDMETEHTDTFELRVTRSLDNRWQGDWEDKSPLAFDLQRRRAQALQEFFDNVPTFSVDNWGDTDDTKPH